MLDFTAESAESKKQMQRISVQFKLSFPSNLYFPVSEILVLADDYNLL
jgi:hypothetical protein